MGVRTTKIVAIVARSTPGKSSRGRRYQAFNHSQLVPERAPKMGSQIRFIGINKRPKVNAIKSPPRNVVITPMGNNTADNTVHTPRTTARVSLVKRSSGPCALAS